MVATLMRSSNRSSSDDLSKHSPAPDLFASDTPLGFAGGDSNLYRYVGNSPTNATDPTGTNPAAAGGVAAAGGAIAVVALAGCDKPPSTGLPLARTDPKIKAALPIIARIKIKDLNPGSPTVGQMVDFNFLVKWINEKGTLYADSSQTGDSWSIGTQKTVFATGCDKLTAADIAVHILGEYWRRVEEPNRNGQPVSWEKRMRQLLIDGVQMNGGGLPSRKWGHPGE